MYLLEYVVPAHFKNSIWKDVNSRNLYSATMYFVGPRALASRFWSPGYAEGKVLVSNDADEVFQGHNYHVMVFADKIIHGGVASHLKEGLMGGSAHYLTMEQASTMFNCNEGKRLWDASGIAEPEREDAIDRLRNMHDGDSSDYDDSSDDDYMEDSD